MARKRLRNHHKFGLGYGIGHKTADLFVKWSVGYQPNSSRNEDWQPTEAVIPMDQRIGRVMMRCGFMESFSIQTHIRKYLDKGDEPMFANDEGAQIPDSGLPNSRLFLMVRQFRKG